MKSFLFLPLVESSPNLIMMKSYLATSVVCLSIMPVNASFIDMPMPISMVLNAIKKLAGIQDDMLIISPTIFESMSNTKSNVLHDKTSLNLEEVIMALTLTKLTNPFAELALREIPNLNGCVAHCTAILSDKDEQAVKALGIDITSNPEFSGNNLYSV